ncbi:hypothetical protein CVT24_012440 [Panaeolus cyanescens]|uniref:Uncharacterized protein n=1 Tax=Panaeolus cyanescens TaxID=181874 RepID=A0A409YJ33_9AGAR|nr:hypothetical protein CVT24_012440 [Panaeolus cyanescens]
MSQLHLGIAALAITESIPKRSSRKPRGLQRQVVVCGVYEFTKPCPSTTTQKDRESNHIEPSFWLFGLGCDGPVYPGVKRTRDDYEERPNKRPRRSLDDEAVSQRERDEALQPRRVRHRPYALPRSEGRRERRSTRPRK